MHPKPYPTHAHPEPALHLLGGIWIASCPTCGYQLVTARSQQRCERRAARRACPVCHQEATP
jgi:NAD-dependent SIR2 family protein deacetylase